MYCMLRSARVQLRRVTRASSRVRHWKLSRKGAGRWWSVAPLATRSRSFRGSRTRCPLTWPMSAYRYCPAVRCAACAIRHCLPPTRSFVTLVVFLPCQSAILTCTNVHLYREVYLVMRITWLYAKVLHQNVLLTCGFFAVCCAATFCFLSFSFDRYLLTYLLTYISTVDLKFTPTSSWISLLHLLQK